MDPDKTPRVSEHVFPKTKILFGALGISLLLLIAFIYTSYIQKQKNKTTSSNTQNKLSFLPQDSTPSIQKFPAPVAETQDLTIYSSDSTTIQKLIQLPFHNQTANLQIPPVLGTDMLYFVDSDAIKSISLNSKEIKSVYSNSSKKTHIAGISYLAPNTLVIELGEPGQTGGGGSLFAKYYFLFLTLPTNETRIIGPFQNTQVYGTFQYLFSTVGGDDIIENSGGDGCGGGSEISQISQYTQSVFIKAGLGCTPGDEYIGALPEKNAILMAERFTDPSQAPIQTETQSGVYATYGSLYLKDVITGDKIRLFNLKTIPDPIEMLTLDRITRAVSIVTTKNIYTLNPLNTAVTSTISSDKYPMGYYPSIENGLLSITDDQHQQLDIINLASGGVKNFPFQTYFQTQNPEPIFIGTWQNMLLYYTVSKSTGN